MPLYFAYGSNLKRDRLEGRLKHPLGPASQALLRDHRVSFHKRGTNGSGFASIINAPGHVVWGVLYDLSDDDLRQLDGFEGVSDGHYRRIALDVERDHGARVAASTYVAEADRVDDTMRPSTKYLGFVIDGAREHGLPATAIAAIEAAARDSPATAVVAAVAQDPGPNRIALGNDMKHEERARQALAALSKDTLAAAADKASVTVSGDKRKLESYVDAILGAGQLDDVLAAIKRDELKNMCRAVGLDDSGKEKDPIVARLTAWLQTGSTTGLVLENPPAPGPKASKPTRANAAGRGGDALPLGDVAADYRHDDAKRKNNPPAGLVEFDRPPARKKKDYAYDPHLDPQLQWAGKTEHTSFEVDTVSLHIHERVSTQAILRAVKRDDAEPQMNLFVRPELPAAKEVDFYSHDVGWSNRLILGDSLTVMNSLLERENMAGQVQCCFIDPPYGIAFNSNFQSRISSRAMKDADDGSLTREPEQIQAYRDTWELGIHSYLTYLRDRLLLARSLLAETGSIFVQISDDNLHHVRELLDEVFGPQNFCVVIAYRRLGTMVGETLKSSAHYLVWYGKNGQQTKYRKLFDPQVAGVGSGDHYTQLEHASTGEVRRMTPQELANPEAIPAVWRPFQLVSLATGGFRPNTTIDYVFDGRKYHPGANKCWRTTREGLDRLTKANRIARAGETIRYKQYLDDFPLTEPTTIWTDTARDPENLYVVQTPTNVIKKCLLMATDPGDLVLDPTCGSGTTAYVAEHWGRRWITCDTSRVALSLARQRLLTARFPWFRTRAKTPRDGFVYRTVPHVTLGAMANNAKIDSCASREAMEKVIRESAEQETLYDQPEENKGKVRVTGPFTVEAIPLASMEDPSRDVDGPVSKSAAAPGYFSDDTSQYLSMMMDLLRQTGVNFPGNKKLRLPSLRAVKGDYEWFHAEASSDNEGDPRRFAVSFGPRHGPVSTTQVMQAIREARGHDVLLFTGFACDPEARKMIDQGMHGTELVFANAAPDILVGDLLKKKRTDQLFAVYGAPDVKVHTENGGSLVSVELVGVDLYDPNTGETRSAKGTDAAALFVDHDYDGKTFCISQALFPGGNNPWEKLQKALKGQIDEEKFAALQTTRSLPFKPGNKVAVKVIDDRGNEVIKIVDARKALKK